MQKTLAVLCAGVLLISLGFKKAPWNAGTTTDDDPQRLPSQEALRNLSQWRSSLFRRAIQLQTATERAHRRQVDPADHARFQLFEPFTACPEREAVERYGGGGDGKQAVRQASMPPPPPPAPARALSALPGPCRRYFTLRPLAAGGKLLCPSLMKDGCVVYSLGSAGNSMFELDILRRTPCEVNTAILCCNACFCGPCHHTWRWQPRRMRAGLHL